MITLNLFLHGLFYGLVMSILLGILITVSQKMNAEMWLEDYPPEIREQFGPMSVKAKKQKGVLSLLFLAAFLGPVIVSIMTLDRPGYQQVFWNVFFVVLTFNVFDLLILDWLIFSTLTPDFIVLPGTEGQRAYKDYRFHARGFGKGLFLTVFISMLAAFIARFF